MADELKNRGAADRSRVKVHEDHEVRYWTAKWGVSKERLGCGQESRRVRRGGRKGAGESMSETDVGASSTAQEGVLYDGAGNRIGGVQPNTNHVEPLVRFARENPITTLATSLRKTI